MPPPCVLGHGVSNAGLTCEDDIAIKIGPWVAIDRKHVAMASRNLPYNRVVNLHTGEPGAKHHVVWVMASNGRHGRGEILFCGHTQELSLDGYGDRRLF